ncbi:inorganic phosphate transporter [Methylomonas sp. SURF-1]|uniref:Inorganic phosphate transporter n=1 Tax=Methylomonas aurea TaxID=2952224 RepID=A0ABT1UFA4_9GAMM|nr:inorganic phosphate transporter [Methylomonas sp. SURF-1]MCQ8180914.1 inorganic phosphate transporter [Methylomonas sp. SURF-1]
MIPLVVIAVGIVLAFDYTNGFHDASNIVAGVVASRAMTPLQAVLVVACFEFLGPLLGGSAVANTLGNLIDLSHIPKRQALTIVISGLFAAVAWNLFTWWKGLPSSSSHALIGGLIGAVLISVGVDPIDWGFSELSRGQFNGFSKVLLALCLSPLLGFLAGFVLQRLTLFLLRAAHPRINKRLQQSQWLTAAALAFAHGSNDAQKSMGILTLVLLLGGAIDSFRVPMWVILLCAGAMTAGTLTGGWRIVRTLGFSIYKIRPIHALNSQLSACCAIFAGSLCGAPVSSTHVVAASIMGIGASERPRTVHWGKAWEILETWLITIPGSALIASLSYELISQLPAMGR